MALLDLLVILALKVLKEPLELKVLLVPKDCPQETKVLKVPKEHKGLKVHKVV